VKKIVIKIKQLPDFELAKNKERGINPGFVAQEFDNLLYGLLSFSEINYIDYCFIAKQNSLDLFLSISLNESIMDSIKSYLSEINLKKCYDLFVLDDDSTNILINTDDYEAFYLKNKTLYYEKSGLKKLQNFLTDQVVNNPYRSSLFYEYKYDFNKKCNYSFLPEVLLSQDQLREKHNNGIIIRVYNQAAISNITLDKARDILISLYYFIKQLEKQNIKDLSFDNPIKTLIAPAGQWIDKLIEDFDNPKIAYHDIIFFSTKSGDAKFIAEFFMSKTSENRFYVCEKLDNKSFDNFINKGEKLKNDKLLEFLKKINEPVKNVYKGLNTGRDMTDPQELEFWERYISSLRPIEELAPACRFIMPIHGNVKGIQSESYPKIDTEGIYLGKNPDNEQPVILPFKNLTKNMFVTGVPGSGKTTVLLNILMQLSLNGTNFLCFEPVKTEFRSLLAMQTLQNPKEKSNDYEFINRLGVDDKKLKNLKKSIRIFTPGNTSVSPFHFNPFIIPFGIDVESHIKSLTVAFEGAIPMVGPTPAIIRDALISLYTDIDTYKAMQEFKDNKTFDNLTELSLEAVICKKRSEEIEFPVMSQFVALIEAIVAKEYAKTGEIGSQIKAFIKNRMSSLTKLTMGKIFNAQQNSFGDISELLKNKVIFEMDALSEEESNLITMFILSQLRNLIKKEPLNADKLKYLIVLEEAHNIVGIDNKNSGEYSSDPKEVATKFITKLMAEVRSYGYGVCISDQFPTAVQPMVVRNTSTKVAHRVISKEDKQRLADSMLLTESQQETLTAFSPGESYVFMEGWLKPLKVEEPHFKKCFSIDQDFDDKVIVEIIKKSDWYPKSKKISDESLKQFEVLNESQKRKEKEKQNKVQQETNKVENWESTIK
jgi:hypothetical protein